MAEAVRPRIATLDVAQVDFTQVDFADANRFTIPRPVQTPVRRRDQSPGYDSS
ncbi:hypothetical protein [Bradyrhizobium sp. SYSU BS000235]|uniref:hypothetical protein n=1 Tax=Bradyrhizobium sp. SYSU BS000235 TaxID=3411332 RepID=UPI003C788C57